MLTALIILIVVTVVAVIASVVGNSDGWKEDEQPIKVSESDDKSTEYFGTLESRNAAALNYERMLNSLKKNSNDFRNLPPQVMKCFDHMATHLATIGTDADPQEWKKTKNGLPPLWAVEDSKHIRHELSNEQLCEKSSSEES